MTILQSILFCVVSLCSSIVGAICGIGGGVIIKPVLDVFGIAGASTISFLSGCTVLSMSCYSVVKSLLSRDKSVNLKLGTPLAIGAAIGGVVGKQLFSALCSLFENTDNVVVVQSVCLAALTVFTLIYTIKKSKIKTHSVSGIVPCVLIGLFLGIFSSFLGIGGGPINLVILFYFFGMKTKEAAATSLYIIFFSQLASLISTIVTGSVPEFSVLTLVLMICGGILGGIIGRYISKRIESTTLDRLFMILMGVIVLISIYNIIKYAI